MSLSRTPHLLGIVNRHGDADGTLEVVSLVEAGLRAANEAEDARRAAEGKDKKLNPHISDAGKCPRKVSLSLLNVEGLPLSVDSLVNFKIGHAVEDAFCEAVAPVGGRILRELRVELPTRGTVVTGRVDVVIETALGLIELKSISSRSMGWMLKNKEQGREEHRKQANLYLHASQEGLLLDAEGNKLGPYDVGYLVYVVKDATLREPPIHAFRVDYDRKMALEDLSSLDTIDNAVRLGLEVPIPEGYAADKFPCGGYCEYRKVCWGAKAK